MAKKKQQKKSESVFKKQKIFLFLAGVLFGLASGSLTAGQAAASEVTPENVIKLVNQERLKHNLPILKENILLKEAAKYKLNDMLKNDYFAHNSPQGSSPWYWFEKAGYDYKYAGENLAINFKSAESQHKAWMESPTHRKNILSERYHDIGVAVTQGKINGEKVILSVQLFGATKAVTATRNQKMTEARQEAFYSQEVAGEEKQQSEASFTTAPRSQALPEIQKENILKFNLFDKSQELRPVCQNGLCYFESAIGQKSNSWQEDLNEKGAWAVVILVMFISISVNLMTLARQKKEENRFITANTMALVIILTTMVLWQVQLR